nr:KDEL motif-containing protein 1-like isoform X2 [Onthophagus taurus]
MFTVFILILTSILFNYQVFSLNISEIKVWGPGLDPENVVLPTRYVFIEANLTIAGDADSFHFEINGLSNNKPCKLRSNILNRKDGVFIFRYKQYEYCDTLKIILTYKNYHIGESPYIFNKVLSEECNCPISIDKFLNNFQCGNVPTRINKDLAEFSEIKWSRLRNKLIKTFDSPGAISLCHYLIKNNVIKRKCYGKYTGFKMFSDSILTSLVKKVKLPDLEFFVNLGDWPLTSEAKKFPIFSWCGSKNSFDIVMPTYDLTESTLENLGRVTLDMLSVQGNVNLKWDERSPKMFWRGRDSNKNRLKLIDISRNHPDLFNVSLTNFFFFRDQEEYYGKQEYISFYKFFDYKYQLLIDGTVSAYRSPYLLGGGSLVFKQKSMYYEHFYNELKPNIHYVSIEEDLSDLVEKIEWAINNDDEARKIGLEGQKFAVENLLPSNVFCYYTQLLNEFSKLLVEKVEDLDDMEIVEVNEENKKCKCLSENHHEKDEL